MPLTSHLRDLARAACATLLSFALAACGGSDDAPASASASATLAAAGGTLDGPSGAQLVVPAGALSQATSITVAQSGAGAPALPGGGADVGAVFALTPHGTAFAAPATIKVPFDASQLGAGEVPTLWKTNAAQTGWDQVAGATVSGNVVQAQITSFSWIVVRTPLFPPTIRVQPAPQSVTEPATATFAVGASSLIHSGPLSYQWRRNGTAIAGATGATYTTGPTSVAADNGALYSVDVSNSFATTASGNAALTVSTAPITTASLTVTVTPANSGTVTSVPAGIACGADCTETYALNTAVTLTATPAAGFTFSAWSPNCPAGAVTMSAGIACTATFVAMPPLATTAQVTGGYDITYFLSRAGQVTRIGFSPLAPVVMPLLSGVRSIAAGSRHLLMLRADGSVWAWGDNLQGQLGDGTRTPRTTAPVQVISPATGVVAIAAGTFTSVALKSDGTVLEWGVDPASGQLSSGLRLSPVAVPGLSNVTAMAVAHGDPFVGHPTAIGHILALRSDGTVWAWGHNGDGALGDGTLTSRATPAPVIGLSGVTMITAGERFAIAVRSDDTVWGWGYGGDAAGVLPRLGATARVLTPRQLDVSPQPVPGLPVRTPTGSLTAIVAGHDHVLALRGGLVVTWGFNLFGQLGIASTVNANDPAVAAGPPGVVTAIGAGSDHSLAIDANGDVWAWGRNVLYQLGDGTNTERRAPVQVLGFNLH